MGGTIQPHPTIPNAIMHVTTSGGGSPMGGSTQMQNAKAQKYPYAPNAIHQYDITCNTLNLQYCRSIAFRNWLRGRVWKPIQRLFGTNTEWQQNTPEAVTLVAGGILDFEYLVSGETDHVQVSCPQTPYSRLLKLWEIHRFQVQQARVSISDSTALGQFNTSIKTGKIDQDSEASVRPLSYVANDSPYQFQSYKIDLARTVYISKVEGIISGIINDSLDNFSQTFSLFVTDSAPTFTQIGTNPSVAGASA